MPAVVMFVKRRKVANSNNNVILSNVNYENNGNGQVAKSRCGKHKDCNGGTSEVIIIELFFFYSYIQTVQRVVVWFITLL